MATPTDVTAFFDSATNTLSYLVADTASGIAAVIDPVLDYDPHSGRTSTESVDTILSTVQRRKLTIAWVLETHVHADHLTAAMQIKAASGASIGIGARILGVQDHFGRLFNTSSEIAPGGKDFDRLIADGDTLTIGGLTLKAMATPGHTPACTTYVVGDAAFVGDTIFMPDYGTARCDFPGGDAATLFRSIRKILALPEDTRIFVGHDYPPEGRDVQWHATVGAQRRNNVHVREGVTEAEFVAMRTARDKTLKLPTLLLPSVQFNLRAGRLPTPESNGVSYLKIPLNRV